MKKISKCEKSAEAKTSELEDSFEKVSECSTQVKRQNMTGRLGYMFSVHQQAFLTFFFLEGTYRVAFTLKLIYPITEL